MKPLNEDFVFYTQPPLSFAYNALSPVISEEQLRIHYEKHHKSYVDKANNILEQMDDARINKIEMNTKSLLKELSFNVGGHILHSIFWENLAPLEIESKPSESLMNVIKKEFISFENFKEEFEKTATSIEGGGWAALVWCTRTKRPLLMQTEKHNVNIYPELKILLLLDVWEHAYYIDYRNNKQNFVKGFWDIINWNEVNERFNLVKNDRGVNKKIC